MARWALGIVGLVSFSASVVPSSAAAAPAGVAASAAGSTRAALGRIGVDTRRLRLSITPSRTPYYRVRAQGGALSLEGSSPVALIHGAYRYAADLGALHVSWDGDRHRPIKYTDFDSGIVRSPFALRAYLNTCTFGYTTPWWNWQHWEREIDRMAVRGVDTPLAMEGQEIVWQRLWRQQGLTEPEIAAAFSAAPYLPWQRMGNIAGFRAPLSDGWIRKKSLLQKRILTRMRALDMHPVLPSFSGYVPKAFAERHPEAKIYRMRPWEGFPGTYWLDPADPLFPKLAKQFIDLYRAEYGRGTYFLLDAFNEMVPPVASDGSDVRAASYGDATAGQAHTNETVVPAVRDARLATYGDRLFRALATAEPNATWVMQGWMFGADKAFWTPGAISAFLSKVPNDRMLILDIGNDRYPGIWAGSNGFMGKNWAYGYVHNYGGSNPVYGDLGFYRRDMTAALRDPRRGNLSGFGMFPEGLNNNDIVYAYAYDLAWGEIGADGQAGDLQAWLRRYLRSRYGSADPATTAAWQQILHGAYTTKYWTPRWWQDQAGGYLFFKFPSLAGADYPKSPGDPKALRAGLGALLAQAGRFRNEPLYVYDLVDFTRHYATLALDDRLKQAVASYARGEIAAGDRARDALVRLAGAIDELAGNQHETLGTWLADARQTGDTPADRAAFVEQAKAIVTVWGGAGHLSDYASRAWQGLYAGYYLPRWQMFLDAQRQGAIRHRPLDASATETSIKAWQDAWLKDGRMWPRRVPDDPVALIGQVLAEVDSTR